MIHKRRRKDRSRSRYRRRIFTRRRRLHAETLEDRRLLASDFGDAPDATGGTGSGNYQTTDGDGGPSHTIVNDLRLGATVDGDDGKLQNVTADADDVDGALPDDEDGLNNPLADLMVTEGTEPSVNVVVTNNTGSAATLAGSAAAGRTLPVANPSPASA